MTATAVRESTRVPADHSSVNVFAGTGTLIRFILRRDRIKLPAWLLGVTLLLAFFASALSEITGTEEQRQDLRRIMDGAIGAVFGPGYGRDDITAQRRFIRRATGSGYRPGPASWSCSRPRRWLHRRAAISLPLAFPQRMTAGRMRLPDPQPRGSEGALGVGGGVRSFAPAGFWGLPSGVAVAPPAAVRVS